MQFEIVDDHSRLFIIQFKKALFLNASKVWQFDLFIYFVQWRRYFHWIFSSTFLFLTKSRLFNFSQPYARKYFIEERYTVGVIRVTSATDGVNDAVSIPTLQQFENPTSIPANSFIPGIDTKLFKHQTIHVKNCLRLSCACIELLFLFCCLFRHFFFVTTICAVTSDIHLISKENFCSLVR